MKKRFFEPSALADLLFEGSPAIFPTDTLPALAALPKFAEQIWEIKKRSSEKPLILMGSSKEELFDFVSSDAIDDAYCIAEKYWPGPLTMVLPSSHPFVDDLNPRGKTIGIRVPDCFNARKLLSKSGPLATTSANFSGQKSIFLIEDIINTFPEIPLLAPIDWPKPSGLASTVMIWAGRGNWQLLRKGAVIPEECDLS